jgi:hypothetical protein
MNKNDTITVNDSSEEEEAPPRRQTRGAKQPRVKWVDGKAVLNELY